MKKLGSGILDDENQEEVQRVNNIIKKVPFGF